MPSKRRHTPPRRDATRRRSAPRHHVPRAEDEPLIVEFREALRTPGGFALLTVAGGVVEALTKDAVGERLVDHALRLIWNFGKLLPKTPAP